MTLKKQNCYEGVVLSVSGLFLSCIIVPTITDCLGEGESFAINFQSEKKKWQWGRSIEGVVKGRNYNLISAPSLVGCSK